MKPLTRLALMSNNADKLAELKQLLVDIELEVVSYLEITNYEIDVIEDGVTYQENALRKVMAPPEQEGVIYLADDSGLAVSAFNQSPGIYSARFAGQGCSYEDNCLKVLSYLGNNVQRDAAFHCVIALRFPTSTRLSAHTIHGQVDGHIIRNPTSLKGFGYDPIFIPKGHRLPFNALSHEIKNKISHRGLALAETKVFLTQVLQELHATY